MNKFQKRFVKQINLYSQDNISGLELALLQTIKEENNNSDERKAILDSYYGENVIKNILNMMGEINEKNYNEYNAAINAEVFKQPLLKNINAINKNISNLIDTATEQLGNLSINLSFLQGAIPESNNNLNENVWSRVKQMWDLVKPNKTKNNPDADVDADTNIVPDIVPDEKPLPGYFGQDKAQPSQEEKEEEKEDNLKNTKQIENIVNDIATNINVKQLIDIGRKLTDEAFINEHRNYYTNILDVYKETSEVQNFLNILSTKNVENEKNKLNSILDDCLNLLDSDVKKESFSKFIASTNNLFNEQMGAGGKTTEYIKEELMRGKMGAGGKATEYIRGKLKYLGFIKNFATSSSISMITTLTLVFLYFPSLINLLMRKAKVIVSKLIFPVGGFTGRIIQVGGEGIDPAKDIISVMDETIDFILTPIKQLVNSVKRLLSKWIF